MTVERKWRVRQREGGKRMVERKGYRKQILSMAEVN